MYPFYKNKLRFTLIFKGSYIVYNPINLLYSLKNLWYESHFHKTIYKD